MRALFIAWLMCLWRTNTCHYNHHGNVSDMLDRLLTGYNYNLRPNLGGPATVVEIDIVVRSMGPISEIDMSYSMDCYFRQTWVDKRLAYSYKNDMFTLGIQWLEKIWKPDTYFYNGKNSYLHTITTPNKLVRLYPDGRVLYSSRLTVKASCPMDLQDFPMDTQRCPLRFGSFAYTTRDVIYKWNNARQVIIAEDMKLSQFDLVEVPSGNTTDFIRAGEYSMLLVSFHLKRHMGNFVIQVYGPCILLVVLSWVSFFLNREATADRVSLGVTTVLTMTFLGLDARTDLPKVPYSTALDFFVALSFGFIFATIIQFALVHYFTKFGSGEVYFPPLSDDSSSEEENDGTTEEDPQEGVFTTQGTDFSTVYQNTRYRISANGNPQLVMSSSGLPLPPPRVSWWARLFRGGNTIKAHIKEQERKKELNKRRLRKKVPKDQRLNSVSKIDKTSRVLFPGVFLILNLFYWYTYLSHSKRLYGT